MIISVTIVLAVGEGSTLALKLGSTGLLIIRLFLDVITVMKTFMAPKQAVYSATLLFLTG